MICLLAVAALLYFGICAKKRYVYFASGICLACFICGMWRMYLYDRKMDCRSDTFNRYVMMKVPVLLKGRVVSFAQVKEGKTVRVKFYFKTNEPVESKFAVHLTTDGKTDIAQLGDLMEIKAKLYFPSRYRLNRNTTYRDYLYFRGISYIAKSDYTKVALISRPKFFSYLSKIRRRMLDNLNAGGDSGQELGYVKAMVFGERFNVDYYIIERLAVLGMIHILVVSGLHVGCLAFVLITFFQFAGLKRRYAEILLIPALVFYLFLAGFGVSLVRAVLAVFFYVFAGILGRERKPEFAVLFAGFIQLLFSPKLIYDAGFQYSYLSVMAIIFVYPALRGFFGKENIFVRYMLISLAVWIVISPFAAYRQGIFYALGFLSGGIVVFIADIVVIAGMFSSAAGFVWGFVSESVNYFNVVLIRLILFLAEIFYENIGIKFYFEEIAYFFLVLYLSVMGLVILYVRNDKLRAVLVCVLFAVVIAAGILF